MTQDKLRSIPSVDQILSSGLLEAEIAGLSRPLVAGIVRETLADVRKAHKKSNAVPSLTELAAQIKERCRILERGRITRVINGTGVLIHTNLGRAPLGRELLNRAAERIGGYSTLEFDLESGKRGRRGSFLAHILAQLTGAESAIAVNNNAAALFLILNTFANKREVLVSRSELVQIGGGFRIPDIIRRAGAKLVEVGTTNQTTLRDYKEAISDKTTMLLKV
ncbi:MAG: L-seryl-tRNA(Sec) selenium transferase, partial [Candidatus Zixiibacteriota bacterium]